MCSLRMYARHCYEASINNVTRHYIPRTIIHDLGRVQRDTGTVGSKTKSKGDRYRRGYWYRRGYCRGINRSIREGIIQFSELSITLRTLFVPKPSQDAI